MHPSASLHPAFLHQPSVIVVPDGQAHVPSSCITCPFSQTQSQRPSIFFFPNGHLQFSFAPGNPQIF
ncbi:MAG: hypothetical protein E7014_06710 [Alphaproteobacteria bacterium]|nr:hypothetical protein [Alphaproteobacteria bacterium]